MRNYGHRMVERLRSERANSALPDTVRSLIAEAADLLAFFAEGHEYDRDRAAAIHRAQLAALAEGNRRAGADIAQSLDRGDFDHAKHLASHYATTPGNYPR